MLKDIILTILVVMVTVVLLAGLFIIAEAMVTSGIHIMPLGITGVVVLDIGLALIIGIWR